MGGSLHLQVVHRHVQPPGEDRHADGESDKLDFAKRAPEHAKRGLARLGLREGRDGEVTDDEEGEEDEGDGTHGPAEADHGDESVDHDGKCDAADAAAGGEDTVGGAALGCEPAGDYGEGFIKVSKMSRGLGGKRGTTHLGKRWPKYRWRCKRPGREGSGSIRLRWKPS